jgi:hypothetical protein
MNDDWVPERLKNDVYEYAREAAAELGLSVFSVEWHASTPEVYQDKYYAWFQGDYDLTLLKNVIHIDVGACSTLSPRELKYTIFHEARHCWQWRTSRFLEPYAAEKDADEWTTKVLGYCSEKGVPYWNLRGRI